MKSFFSSLGRVEVECKVTGAVWRRRKEGRKREIDESEAGRAKVAAASYRGL